MPSGCPLASLNHPFSTLQPTRLGRRRYHLDTVHQRSGDFARAR
jgi:hypothetical protein